MTPEETERELIKTVEYLLFLIKDEIRVLKK
jgi:hypothetical protein